MDWRALVFPPPPSTRASVGLLVLRAFAGGAMMSHGWSKVQNPFHWMDKAASPAPAPFQALAALAEFGGGLALILGLLTALASLGLIATMAVAIQLHVAKGDPFGKWELAALYLVVSLLLLLGGPGRFALDELLARKVRPEAGASSSS